MGMNTLTLRKTLKALLDGGMTQEQIARELGCRQATISRIVTGKRGANPSYSFVERLNNFVERQLRNGKIES